MNCRPSSPITAALVAAALAPMALADSVVIVADRDATIYSEADDKANGSGSRLFAGRTDNADLRRCLVHFDLAAAGIPDGSTVTAASLRLYMSRTQAGNTGVSLRPLTTDWGEGPSDPSGQEGAPDSAEDGDCTWVYTFYDTNDPQSAPQWNTDGGDFGASSATTTVGGNGFYTWGSTASMVSDVQGWLDTPATNFGWILIGNEGSNKTAKRFDSRENNDADNWPRLTVTFDPPAVDGACCYPDGTCLVQSAGDCNQQGGIFQAIGSNCGEVDCPVIVGACCFDDSTCTEVTESACGGAGGDYQGDGTTCTVDLCPLVLEPYVDPMPIPPVMQPVSGSPGGEATYEIAVTEFQQQLHRDLPPTTCWGYDGTFPAKTIEARRDLPITVTWINQLPATHYLPVDLCPHGVDDDSSRIVTHLHGGHVPAEVDGYPEDWFLPGNSDTYVYPNNQEAATIWFHDHALGITRLNVYMGMAGFYLVRDDVEDALDLPDGDYEIPVVIQDRAFNADGSWKYPAEWQDAFFGDKILVNGKVWPYLDVEQARYRFRLLNGSNSRTYALTLSNGLPFHQIGTDGGLLESTVTLNELIMSPGERADVIVDFTGETAGTEIFLVNSAPAPYPGTPGLGVVPDVMKFVVLDQAGNTPQIPSQLRPMESLDPDDAAEEREFILRKYQTPGGCAAFEWRINDLGWDDITEYPRLGQTEIWRFVNESGMVHPMHMHLVFFQVLDRQDFEIVDGEISPIGDPVPPDPNEEGWKDTVKALPQQITRVIARFEDYEGLYAYHCHLLEHEDHEMMRQFLTLPECPADFDDSNVVDSLDFLLLIGQWGSPANCPEPPCEADFTGPIGEPDGNVDSLDYLGLIAAWGDCPGPTP
jgi:spore coat protein A